MSAQQSALGLVLVLLLSVSCKESPDDPAADGSGGEAVGGHGGTAAGRRGSTQAGKGNTSAGKGGSTSADAGSGGDTSDDAGQGGSSGGARPGKPSAQAGAGQGGSSGGVDARGGTSGVTDDGGAGAAGDHDGPGIPDRTDCRLLRESTNLAGNAATYIYTYGEDGNVSKLERFLISGANLILESSSTYGDRTVVTDGSLNYPPGATTSTTHYEGGGIFDGWPTRAELAFTEDGITHVNVNSYYFFYDVKDRLVTVGQQTDLTTGDYEYDLTIAYDGNDDATSLGYEFTTGPAGVTAIVATGYDDHPTPYAAFQHPYFLMRAAWDNYDSAPVLTAVSKHNPLGFTQTSGWRRDIAYTYNEHGYPLTRTHTNTAPSGESASFVETLEYECP